MHTDASELHCPSSPVGRTLVVSAGIVWRNGCFVGTQRTRGNHAGQWEFPGGKVRMGESRINALARELREELGIIVEKAEPWRVISHDYPDRRVHLSVYHVISFSGEPSGREGQNLRWLTVYEAARLPFLEADAPLIRELAGETPFLPNFHPVRGWNGLASGLD
jgi:8-oxo-dGTP diphosphatase